MTAVVRGRRARVAGVRPPARTRGTRDSQQRRTLAHDVTTLSSLFAPVTVVGALLLYIGWVRTRAFFTYFGIDPGMLGFGPQGYILRSGQVGLGAVVILAIVAGVLIALDRAVTALLGLGGASSGWIPAGLAIVGAGCVLIGLFQVLDHARVAAAPPDAWIVLAAGGALVLLRFGSATFTRSGVLGAATNVFGLIVIGLAVFSLANTYAQDIGRKGAAAIDQDPSGLAVVTIFSGTPLDLSGANVAASRTETPEGKWAYRYSGAQLLTYANDRWFLLVSPASPDYHSRVVILSNAEGMHVETAVPRK
ncbi:hypothetical protein [Pseudonocardia cypriaca]|uniref:Uncharacterized protein n=1 Tax=Pseudonocardia cypriaca TaxID=882449 RepID=A0A543GI94_9PSEU|nr:hypothetical protein [Pseudonocardia cypriaca]TQM45807.1 hypothetical protein FB388_3207 [Pseudonocardia cypriaca]